MLVYEFMHNGTVKEHLYGELKYFWIKQQDFECSTVYKFLIGPLTREQSINWIKRLEVAEDAAKGL
jgi:hypothetical protein